MKRRGKRNTILAGVTVLALGISVPGLTPSDLLSVQASPEAVQSHISLQKETTKKPRVVYSRFDKKSSVLVIGRNHVNVYESKEIDSFLKSPSPQTVSRIKSISGKAVNKIVFKNTLCGVLVEPSQTGKFELDYTGIEEEDMFTVDTKIEKGVLTITTKGKPGSGCMYIDTDPGHLVNTVRVRIPVKKYDSIKVAGDCGNTLFHNISAPLTGNAHTGGVKVVKKNQKHRVKLKCTSGDIVLVSKKMKAGYQLSSENGDVHLYGEKIAGSGKLHCINGDVGLEAEEISSPAELSCENGDVHFAASKVNGKVKLSCTNGDIDAEIGTLLKDMSFKMDNGDGGLTFKRKPENLTYRGPKAHAHWGEISLPGGWKDGWHTGTGKPVLTVKMGNGDLVISY